MFGMVKGQFLFIGVIGQKDGFWFLFIEGEINKVQVNGYDYMNIVIFEGLFIENVFILWIDINDLNLYVFYEGWLNFGERQEFNVKMDFMYVDFGKFYFVQKDFMLMVVSLVVNIEGININDYLGWIDLNKLMYIEQG